MTSQTRFPEFSTNFDHFPIHGSGGGGIITMLDFSPNGEYVASGDDEGLLSVR